MAKQEKSVEDFACETENEFQNACIEVAMGELGSTVAAECKADDLSADAGFMADYFGDRICDYVCCDLKIPHKDPRYKEKYNEAVEALASIRPTPAAAWDRLRHPRS